MAAYIVVEGNRDKALVEKLLPDDLLRSSVLVPGGGYSGALSLAHSLAVVRRQPIALVVDSDSVNPEAIRDRRSRALEMLTFNAGSVRCKVILAVPELEVVLRDDPCLLERVAGSSIPEVVRVRAEAQPKAALETWLRDSGGRTIQDVLDAIGPDDVQIMRQAEPIRELIEFLRIHAASQVTANAAA